MQPSTRNKLIYLDNSATSFPKPEMVHNFMRYFYKKHGLNPGRSQVDAATDSEGIINNTRKLLTNLFNGGADYNRLTFSYNATDSLNIIINGLVEKGAHVITTKLEHNSVLRPLYMHQFSGLIDVTFVSFNKNGYVDPDDIKKAIRPTTKFVVITHCSNVLGTIQPVKEIGKICKDNGVLLVVDGSQAAGAIEVDMQECNIDVYCFTGHKCLMGPTGIGGSYVREGVIIKNTRAGGTGICSLKKSHLENYPNRLEYGTLNLLGIAGLNAGVRWVLGKGINKLHSEEMLLWDKLRKGLQNIEGVTTYCAENPTDKNPVLSFNIEKYEATEVGKILDSKYNIAVRTGLECAPLVHEEIGTLVKNGTVRMSIGPFITESDIDSVIRSVEEIASIESDFQE